MNTPKDSTAERTPGSLQCLVGPCPDVEQRIKDLYIVNTVAGWAQNQLRILGDMAADHKLPDWYVSEVRRIQSKIETVAQRDDARRSNGKEFRRMDENYTEIQVYAEPPTVCRWANGVSQPLKGWKEKPLRQYAEWMWREIIKAGGYEPGEPAQHMRASNHRSVTAAVARLLTGHYAPQDVIDVCKAATVQQEPTVAAKDHRSHIVGGDFYNGIEWMACWLLDNAEGETITEEQLRPWAAKAWSKHLAQKEADAAPPATATGPAKQTKSCINCCHCGKNNSAEVRCLYNGERSPEVVAMTSQSQWTRATAAEICNKYEAL